MSPSEFDLRAALRDGEGENIDPDTVIAGGRTYQAQRRARLRSTAIVTVLVAAAGTGGAVIWNRSGDDNAATSTTAQGGYNAQQHSPMDLKGGAAGGAVPKPVPSASAARAAKADQAVPCPASLPRYLLPGGGSPGQFGASGQLFSQPVATAVVCSYGSKLIALGSTPVSAPARLVLTGDKAVELTQSLEQAATTRSTAPCPDIRPADERELAIIGVTADGSTLRTVTADLARPACQAKVSNGTAIRYQWTPPADLRSVLISLTPRTSGVPVSPPVIRPSGRNHGSPIHS